METDRALIDAVKKAATEMDGRATLSCAKAFALAEQFGTRPSVVGGICNKECIKIVQCQLGCFR
jgi:hypothetical protein